MKKSVLLFVLLLASVGMWAQTLIYEKDWTGGFEGDYPYWYQCDASQDVSVVSDPEGVAITVDCLTGQLWQPQIEVTPLGAFDLYQFDNYKIVITAKYPTDGQLQLHLGNWSGNFQEVFYVKSTGDFQTDEFFFSDPAPADYEACHLMFQCGDFLGTTIIKKIQIWDLDGNGTPYVPGDDPGYNPGHDPGYENPIYEPAGVLIAEKDWTGVESLPWWQFSDEDNGSVDVDPDGIAVTVTEKTGQLWQPQGFILQEGDGLSLKESGNYRVVINAKFPCDGTLQVNMGSWECSYQYQFPVKATGDFQTVFYDFYDCPCDAKDAHVIFQCGDFLGTTIIKNVQVFDLDKEYEVEPIAYQSKDWDEAEEYPYEYTNEDGYAATLGEEGVEVNVPDYYWTPSTTIFDGATLKAGHSYKVVVTAKIPANGTLEVGLGNNYNKWWNGISVTASDEFQQISFRFNEYGINSRGNGEVVIDSYGLLGTTIIKKVEIVDTACDPIPYQSKDWANCTEEDLYWTGFAEGQEVTVEATSEGIAVTNPEYSSNIYEPQTKIIDNITLKRDHNYIVRVTAKIPSEGTVQVNMRDWDGQDGIHCSMYVYPSDDFQDIDFEYISYPNDCNGDAHVLFQTGWIVGTTVIKEVQIFDMSMLTPYDIMAMTGKIKVMGYQELDFPKDTDPDFKPSIELSYDNNDRNLGRLTLNGNLSAISDLSMWYDFAKASDYGRWYEDLMSWDNDRQYFTSFINNAATSIDAATVTIRLMPYRWEFITLPFDVRVKDIKGSNNVPFVIRKYDGQKRAEGLLDETWVDMTENDILQAGVGYIWQTAYNYDGDYYNTFVLKAAQNANLNKVLTSDDVEMPLDVHKGDLSWNLGWNLIGNPYPSYFDSRAMSFTAPFTVWSNYYGTYEAFSPIDDAYILNPGQAFFVQSTEDQSSIIFRSEGRQSDLEVNYDAVYGNRARQVTPSAERKVVNLIVSNGEFGDRTRIVINPEASLSYEADKDANKFMSADAKAIQLYSIEQGVAYAINERPLSTGEVQLGINCIASGTYTLTMRTSADCTVVLIDRLTGEEVILDDTEGYTFQSETGTFDNRFVVRFSVGDNATGIQTVTDAQPTDNIYYDMQGRRISRPEKGIYIQNGKKVMVK